MLPCALRHVQRAARRPLQPVTIQHLLERSKAATDEDHVAHARWLRGEMPVRLAHRLEDFMRLPFVVVCNMRVHEVFRIFLDSFEFLENFGEIEDIHRANEFADKLRDHLGGHAKTIQMLQEGHGELSTLLGNLVDLDRFLNQVFFTRIGNRALAEHFLLIHDARGGWGVAPDSTNSVGIVTRCCPAEIVRELTHKLGTVCTELYGAEPEVIIEGQVDTTFSYVHEHVYFMLQEILKNAFCATIDRHRHCIGTSVALPPVTVEIMRGRFAVTLKVSDCGGGMSTRKLAQIWKYGYTSTKTAGQNLQMSGFGFGLPLSRVYAQYFGGDISLQSMSGYGTDVYLSVNHLGKESDSRLVAS